MVHCQVCTMDLEAHSYEVHMKPYIHNFPWNLFELHKNLLLTSYELHMKFIWNSHEFRMKWNRIYSCEFHEKFTWTSYGIQMNFYWISYEMKSNLFIWIYMQFVWSSYELHIEGLMKLICYSHVILMKLTWGSKTVRMKYIWNSYELQMIWNSCELHVNFIRIAWQIHMPKFLGITHEYGFWHPCYVLHMNEPPGPS